MIKRFGLQTPRNQTNAFKRDEIFWARSLNIRFAGRGLGCRVRDLDHSCDNTQSFNVSKLQDTVRDTVKTGTTRGWMKILQTRSRGLPGFRIIIHSVLTTGQAGVMVRPVALFSRPRAPPPPVLGQRREKPLAPRLRAFVPRGCSAGAPLAAVCPGSLNRRSGGGNVRARTRWRGWCGAGKRHTQGIP